MPGDYDFDFGAITKRKPKPLPKHDPVEDMLRLGAAPLSALGSVGGGIVGGLVGGPMGVPAGIGIGSAAGTAIGAAGTGIADVMGRDEEEAARRQAEEEEERAAQHRAALSMLGGL
jgi:uncharacterized protein YcfJ